MKIHETVSEIATEGPSIVTSGTFDGVHLGHQKILSRLREIADLKNGQVTLITFWPHPRLVLKPEHELLLINTFEEKARLLEKYGVDHLVKIPFTESFSKMSSTEFIQKILVKQLQTDILVIGYDHRFGRNREGSFDYLKQNEQEFSFQVEEIPRQMIDDIGISSTKIRKALMQGCIQQANEFMGHCFELSGEVIHGDKIGTELGFPTANIFVNSANKLIPADGVYAVEVDIRGQRKNGMLYIGSRPTINGHKRNIEVNIFDFEENIYANTIRTIFVAEVRGDIRFDNLDELRVQLGKDKEQSIKLLDRYGTQS